MVPFIETPVSALENKAVELSVLFGEEGKKLEENVIATEGNSMRKKLIEEFLLSRLATPQSIDIITK